MWKSILHHGLKTGIALTITTTAAILIAGESENGEPWSAINAVAHIIDGDDITQPSGFSPRESFLGLAVNAAAMGFWGVVYEGLLTLTRKKSNSVTAIAAATGAYVTDYVVVPKRLTPGIEKKLSLRAIISIYAVLAAALALSPLWNDYDDTRTPETAITA